MFSEQFLKDLRKADEATRKATLEGAADTVAKETYSVEIEAEELAQMKATYFSKKAELEALADEIAEIKANMKPVREAMNQVWPSIKAKSRMVTGTLYGFKDYEAGLITFVDENANEIYSRRMTASDNQTFLKASNQ